VDEAAQQQAGFAFDVYPLPEGEPDPALVLLARSVLGEEPRPLP
jgi:hypothetical protein